MVCCYYKALLFHFLPSAPFYDMSDGKLWERSIPTS